MIISFAWTTAALLAGRKSRTRRYWKPEYAARFKPGSLHDAYDRSPRYHGKKVGTVQITRRPYQQHTSKMTEEDYEAEGFKWMEENNKRIRFTTPRAFFEGWKLNGQVVYVVDFQFFPLEGSAEPGAAGVVQGPHPAPRLFA